MGDFEIQKELNDFETHMLGETDAVSSRAALRAVLFGFAGTSVEGSVADGVRMLAEQPRPPAGAASVMLRAIADDNLLTDKVANQLSRNVVALVEGGLPGLSDFLKLSTKKQTHEKFEILRGAKTWVEDQLEPLRVPYTTLESMLAARNLSRCSQPESRS